MPETKGEKVKIESPVAPAVMALVNAKNDEFILGVGLIDKLVYVAPACPTDVTNELDDTIAGVG